MLVTTHGTVDVFPPLRLERSVRFRKSCEETPLRNVHRLGGVDSVAVFSLHCNGVFNNVVCHCKSETRSIEGTPKVRRVCIHEHEASHANGTVCQGQGIGIEGYGALAVVDAIHVVVWQCHDPKAIKGKEPVPKHSRLLI